MKPLALDLVERRSPLWGWLVLALGLFAAADLAHTYLGLEQEIAAAEDRVALAQRRPAAAGAAVRLDESLTRSLQQADRVVKTLTLPWEPLFAAVESATDERIALLALQPDPQKGEISISGEAIDYAAILAYVSRLDQRSGLRDVHLVKHEMRQEDPQRPTFFRIVAHWEPAR